MQDQTEKTRDVIVASFFVCLLFTTVCAFIGSTFLMAAGTSLMLCFAAALGAVRNGRVGAFKPWLIAAGITWILVFALMHGLSSGVDELWGGLPKATAAALYGLWFAPLLLVTLPYAFLFHGHVLSEETLKEISGHGERNGMGS